MNIKKTSNLLRMIAFFLTAIILCCTFGFTVDGWFDDSNDENHIIHKPNNDTSQNEEVGSPPDINKPEEIIPLFYNQLTGLICSEEEYNSFIISYILTQDAEYGLSSSDIVIEIPVENNETRLISISKYSKVHNKIGSFAPARSQILDILSNLSDVSVSYGYDDNIISQENTNTAANTDLSINGYYYNEFGEKAYSNSEMLDVAIKSIVIDRDISQRESSLLNFCDCENPITLGNYNASLVEINNCVSKNLSFVYNAEFSEYNIYINNVKSFDRATGTDLFFTNCLILFSDFITYEKSDYTQSVINSTEGKGYYFTMGGIKEIYWSFNSNGEISFLDELNNPIVFNRGKTYISILKSSQISTVEYS